MIECRTYPVYGGELLVIVAPVSASADLGPQTIYLKRSGDLDIVEADGGRQYIEVDALEELVKEGKTIKTFLNEYEHWNTIITASCAYAYYGVIYTRTDFWREYKQYGDRQYARLYLELTLAHHRLAYGESGDNTFGLRTKDTFVIPPVFLQGYPVYHRSQQDPEHVDRELRTIRLYQKLLAEIRFVTFDLRCIGNNAETGHRRGYPTPLAYRKEAKAKAYRLPIPGSSCSVLPWLRGCSHIDPESHFNKRIVNFQEGPYAPKIEIHFWRKYVELLDQRIRELEAENESLRLRLPEAGGEDYEAALQDFSQHC